jgi:hypothetical protein
MGGPQSQSGCGGKEKDSLPSPCRESNPGRNLGKIQLMFLDE